MTLILPMSLMSFLSIIMFVFLVNNKTNGLRYGPSLLLPSSQQDHHRFLQDESKEDIDQVEKQWGDASCPCIAMDEWSRIERHPLKNLNVTIGEGVNHNTYGIGCHVHDIDTNICSNVDDCVRTIPVPSDCDKSYCYRSFCYVDTKNCELFHSESTYFENAYYSYATCGYMDSFTNADRMDSLRGQTFDVALNSNSGGWLGAYNPEGSFAINDQWSGPVVEFLMESAERGGFRFNITKPPEWLREHSLKFFGKSSFDYCIYATSLGYLDMCIAGYTITGKRGSVTPFMEITNDPVFLVTFVDGGMSSIEELSKSFLLIFQPFTGASWLLIVVVFLPLLGMIMLFHEYGGPGSVFPNSEKIHVINTNTGQNELQLQKVSITKHIFKSLYMPYLAFLNGSYDPAILSTGGKVNLIAIMFFILLVTSVYTANLTAILTQEISKTPVSNLQEAVQAGYNFCITRKLVPTITGTYGLDPNRIVVDPMHIGGDGQPGFNCPNCKSRIRVFDFMQVQHSDPSLYCNAAIVPLEDLTVLYSKGLHCNKTIVGDILFYRSAGIPIYDDDNNLAGGMISWLMKMKVESVLDTILRIEKPVSECPSLGDSSNSGSDEGNSLTVKQCLGIWFGTIILTLLGLFIKFLSPLLKTDEPKGQMIKFCRRDQWGNPVESGEEYQQTETIDRVGVEMEMDSVAKQDSVVKQNNIITTMHNHDPTASSDNTKVNRFLNNTLAVSSHDDFSEEILGMDSDISISRVGQ